MDVVLGWYKAKPLFYNASYTEIPLPDDAELLR